MKIWSNTIVRNEERYIWFSLMSVVEYVDKMLVWDTGSDDSTVAIIKEIKKKYPNKIVFKQIGEVSPLEFTKVSQRMFEATKSDWLLLLDGDEVWWDGSVKSLINLIYKSKGDIETVVQPYYNIVGDIFHYQQEEAGMYEFDGRRGHLTIRAMAKGIPGLHFNKEHGQRGLYDKDGRLIQKRNVRKRKFLNSYYLHFTNMPRSSTRQKDLSVPKRGFKYKYELGHSFAKEFYYPEAFFLPRPGVVPSPWLKRSSSYVVRAAIETPLKRAKRKIEFLRKSGY